MDTGRAKLDTAGRTIFEQGGWAIAAMDEAAKLRNPNQAYVATWDLFKKSHARIAMTATPIQNGPMVSTRTLCRCRRPLIAKQDLYFIGLILGIPICEDGQLGQKIKRDMAKVARKALAEFKEAKKDRHFVKRLLRREVDLPMKQTQMDTMHSYVDEFRVGFAGYIIRRTIKSVDWEGKPIAGLPPLHEQVLALKPSPEERRALRAMANEILRDDNATKAKYIHKADNVSTCPDF